MTGWVPRLDLKVGKCVHFRDAIWVLESEQRIGGMDPMIHNRKLHSEGKLSDAVMENMDPYR